MTYYVIFDPRFDTTLPYVIVRDDGYSTRWGTSVEEVVNTDTVIDIWQFDFPITPDNIVGQMDPDYVLLAVINSDEPPSREFIQSYYPELLL